MSICKITLKKSLIQNYIDNNKLNELIKKCKKSDIIVSFDQESLDFINGLKYYKFQPKQTFYSWCDQTFSSTD